MSVSRRVRDGSLQAASVVLPVAVAVASNQILNDGKWNWWWALGAVVLSAAGGATAFLLLRRRPPSPEPSAPSAPPAPAQEVVGTTAEAVRQLRDVRGSVRFGAKRRRRPPARPTTAPAPDDEDQPTTPEPSEGPGARQTVRDSRITGSVIQIHGVGGDVEIDEP